MTTKTTKWRKINPTSYDKRTWVRSCGPFVLSIRPPESPNDTCMAYALTGGVSIWVEEFRAERQAKAYLMKRATQACRLMMRDLGIEEKS